MQTGVGDTSSNGMRGSVARSLPKPRLAIAIGSVQVPFGLLGQVAPRYSGPTGP